MKLLSVTPPDFSLFIKSRTMRTLVILIGIAIFFFQWQALPSNELLIIDTMDQYHQIEQYYKVGYVPIGMNHEINEYYDAPLSREEMDDALNENPDNRFRFVDDALSKLKRSIEEGNYTEIVRNNLYYNEAMRQMAVFGVVVAQTSTDIFKPLISEHALSVELFNYNSLYYNDFLAHGSDFAKAGMWLREQILGHHFLSIFGIMILLTVIVFVNMEYQFKKKHISMLDLRPQNRLIKELQWVAMQTSVISGTMILTYFFGFLLGLFYLCGFRLSRLGDVIVSIFSSIDTYQTLFLYIATLIISVLFCYLVLRISTEVTKSPIAGSSIVIILYAMPYLVAFIFQSNLGFSKWNPFMYIDLEKSITGYRESISSILAYHELFTGWLGVGYLFLIVIILLIISFWIEKLRRRSWS